MIQIFRDPYIWLGLVAVLTFLLYLLRGLKTLRWRLFTRLFICFSCIFAVLILSPYAASARLRQVIASTIVIAAALAIVIDILVGLILTVKRAIIPGRDFAMPLADYLMEISQAMEVLASRRIGALIILKGKDKLDEYMDSGIFFDAQIRSEILIALFSSASPVHDGAVIVAHGRIRKVKAILSLKTDTEVPMGIGTRHRSALGITEKTDAIALVVSEERGEISIAFRGSLVKVDSPNELCRLIKKALKGKSIVVV